jgi:DeoR/GlpR family transcriptional regulator of sugar metabolism
MKKAIFACILFEFVENVNRRTKSNRFGTAFVQRTRLNRIEQLLRQRGACSVEFLSRELGVSDMTIRRDLQQLADAGRVVRTHGGAAPAEQVLFEFQFLRRARLHQRHKQQIGACAASLVADGQSVLLDSGTTTLAVARCLRQRQRLTVITTSLPVASVLQHAAGVQTLLLGGFVRRDAPDLSGPLTEANLENLRADLAFLGADGIDLLGNVYNASLSVARMLSKMAVCAAAVYVVADSSKLGHTALMRFGNLADWRGLITDAQIQPQQLNKLRDRGVNVIVADATSGPPKQSQSNGEA